MLNLHRDEFSYFEWHRVMMMGIEQGALVLSEPCFPFARRGTRAAFPRVTRRGDARSPRAVARIDRRGDPAPGRLMNSGLTSCGSGSISEPNSARWRSCTAKVSLDMLDIPTAPATVLFESIHHAASQVTVAVTLYDYKDFVLEALDSVVAQDLADLDLVVVDDDSTDGGERRVLDWLQSNDERFGRAILLRHTRNQGLAAARNQGFATASTPYVFVLDADNHLYPRCLTACLEAARGNNADMVYTILEVFGEQQGVMGTDVWDPVALQAANYIDAMALVARAAWQQVGGYRRMETAGWEDYDFWLKFAEAGFDVVRVPEILCRYRQHGGSMLRSVTESARNHRCPARRHAAAPSRPSARDLLNRLAGLTRLPCAHVRTFDVSKPGGSTRRGRDPRIPAGPKRDPAPARHVGTSPDAGSAPVLRRG